MSVLVANVVVVSIYCEAQSLIRARPGMRNDNEVLLLVLLL